MIKTSPAGRRRTSGPPLPGSPSREKILLAAIEAIEKEGLPAVTIRSIAQRAGVNSAAINYYFRTKDKLLEEVSRTTVEHSLDDLKAILDSGTGDPRAPLEDFLGYLMEGAVLYPGITKSHMYDVLVGRKADNPFLRRINVLLARLAERLESRKSGESRDAIRTKIVQMMSAVVLPALMPEAFRPLTGKSFHDPKVRRSYIRSVVKTCFKDRG